MTILEREKKAGVRILITAPKRRPAGLGHLPPARAGWGRSVNGAHQSAERIPRPPEALVGGRRKSDVPQSLVCWGMGAPAVSL